MFIDINSLLDEYIINSKIGGENFSTVYEATHKQDGVKRAIKVMDINKFCSLDFDFYVKLNKQIDLLERINKGEHPNIIHYHKIAHYSHYIILEMQYINGVNINDYLRDNRYFVETKEIINLVIDIGRALKFLHHDICYLRSNENASNNIINKADDSLEAKTKDFVLHNDIHTWNILRDVSGKYILIDLDFAIEGNPRDYEKRHHIDVIGAPCFKAPEKWKEGADIGTQSDIYSFGIVIYCFLTGVSLFPLNNSEAESEKLTGWLEKIDPNSIFELRKRHFERKYPNKVYIKDYPKWLEEVILKCLKYDYNERFKDGNEFYEYINLI